MSNTLYVKNLSLQATEDDLHKLFSLIGKVVRIHLIKDAQSGHFVGAGYVTMATEAAARSARIDLDGTRLIDRNIVVTEARQRTAPARTPGSGSGRPGSGSRGSGSGSRGSGSGSRGSGSGSRGSGSGSRGSGSRKG